MSSRPALLVACLIALAGCSAVPLGGDSGPETVTPVAVEATESRATPVPIEDLSPGVAPDGTVDGSALRAAHDEALGGQSYTWSVVGSTAPAKDSDQTIRRRVTVERERVLVREARSFRDGNVSLYANGSRGYLRSNTDDGPRFTEIPRPLPNRTYAFGGSLIEEFLDDVTVEADVLDRDGRTLYRLRAADDPPPAVARPGRTVRNYSATAYVRPSGLVRTLAVEYDQRTDDGWGEFAFRFDYSRVGETTVTEPDWVSTARAAAGPPTPAPETSWSDSTPREPDRTATTGTRPATATETNRTTTARDRQRFTSPGQGSR